MVSHAQRICSDVLVLVFFVAGIAKVAKYGRFMATLGLLPYLPRNSVHSVGMGVIIVEMLVAVGLFMDLSFAPVLGVALLISFISVAILVIRRRLRIPCGCFGFDEEYLSHGTIRRNVILCIGLVLLMTASSSPEPHSLVATLAGLSCFTIISNAIFMHRTFL